MKNPVLVFAIVGSLLLIAGCSVAPKQGDPAPRFTCVLTSGERSSLDRLLGDNGAVLYFYPAGEAPEHAGGHDELQTQLQELSQKGYNIVCVAVDLTSTAVGRLEPARFSVVHDAGGAIAALYNVPTGEDPFRGGWFQRTFFVISREADILSRYRLSEPDTAAGDTYCAWTRDISEPF